ncbi:MAG: hypothetical protein AAFV78_15870, partial [Bacteroidota bacterium]
EIVSLIGKVGISITRICMMGRVEIEGKFYDAFCRGFPIAKGTQTRVVDTHLKLLLIEPIDFYGLNDQIWLPSHLSTSGV